MYKYIMILQLIARCGIGGAGLGFLSEQSGMSLYVVRGLLDGLCEDGAVVRVKGKYFLTLIGNNIALAQDAAKEGYEVSVVKNSEWSYTYQKALF
jgi:DNA-binding IclR family transcriptional regulator